MRLGGLFSWPGPQRLDKNLVTSESISVQFDVRDSTVWLRDIVPKGGFGIRWSRYWAELQLFPVVYRFAELFCVTIVRCTYQANIFESC